MQTLAGRTFWGHLAGIVLWLGLIAPPSAAQVPNFTQIAAGTAHACARASGQVWCWGANNYGQLGDGTTVGRMTPAPVQGLSGVVEIASGGNHSCARLDTGHLRCWGFNAVGQLGNGATTDAQTTPVAVRGLNRAVGISLGDNHSCALRDTGRVFCWGRNNWGQLGDGARTNRTTQAIVGGLSNVVEISMGGDLSCARRDTGRVFCWGYDLSNSSSSPAVTSPRLVTGLSRVVEIAVGGYHACARRDTGRVFCWGFNWYGQLGSSDGGPAAGLSNVVEIAAGTFHSCARRDSGRVFCWGRNDWGQLGNGPIGNDAMGQVRVRNVANAIRIAAGGILSCALIGTGSATCWGGVSN